MRNNTYVEVFRDLFRSDTAMAISIPNVGHMLEFIQNILKEHVLGDEAVDQRALPLDSGVKKNIRKRYLQVKSLTADYDKARSYTSDETITLSVVPTRGILGELSGYFCDACWTSQTNIMADNPNMVAFYFVENADDPASARIVGGSLLILTQPAGKEAFVIRGLNPQDRIANHYNTDDIIRGFLEYLDTIPKTEDERLVLAPPGKSGALSNRPGINRAMPAYMDKDTDISLDESNNFNGYNITNNVRIVNVPAEADATKSLSAGTVKDMDERCSKGVGALLRRDGPMRLDIAFVLRNNPFGLIISASTIRPEDISMLNSLADKKSIQERDKFIILLDADTDEMESLRQEGLSEDIASIDSFLSTIDGAPKSRLQRLSFASSLLLNQSAMCAGMILNEETARGFEEEPGLLPDKVFIRAQIPVIDETTNKSIVLLKAMLLDALNIFHGFGSDSDYILERIIDILPPVTSTEFIEFVDGLGRTYEEILRQA